MDNATMRHLNAWLDRTVDYSERDAVESGILRILAEHPELSDKGYSWPEIGQMAGVWSL